MAWLLINDSTEIDKDLITCAEYQLFLQETIESRPPSHWKNERFLPGTAKLPVTGVNPNQALAFCEWLNREYQGKGFKYRLPTLAEAQQYPLPHDNIGYWCNNTEKLFIYGISDEQWQSWKAKHYSRVELGFIRELLDTLIYLLESLLDLNVSLILILDRIKSQRQQHDKTNNRARILNHSLKRVRSLVLILSQNLAQELDNIVRFQLDFPQEWILEKNNVFAYLKDLTSQLCHSLEFDYNIILDLDLIKNLDLGFKGELISQLDLTNYLAFLHEQLLSQARNLTKILNSKLVNELTSYLTDNYNFDEVVEKIRNTDLKELPQSVINFESLLTANLDLLEKYPKHLDLALDCLRSFSHKNHPIIIRCRILLIASCWYYLSFLDYTDNNLNPKKTKHLQVGYEQNMREVLDFYSTVILLGLRKNGDIPPWESIRLVREEI